MDPANQPGTVLTPGPAGQVQPPVPPVNSKDKLKNAVLLILAAFFVVGILLPTVFSNKLLAIPLAVFAILGIERFHKDTTNNVPASGKAIHLFKLLVKIGLISVVIIIALIIFFVAAIAQSGF